MASWASLSRWITNGRARSNAYLMKFSKALSSASVRVVRLNPHFLMLPA